MHGFVRYDMLKSADIAVSVLHELAPLVGQALGAFGLGADGSRAVSVHVHVVAHPLRQIRLNVPVPKRNLLPLLDIPVGCYNDVLAIVYSICITEHPKEGWR